MQLYRICGMYLCILMAYVECICAASWKMRKESVYCQYNTWNKSVHLDRISGKNVCFRQIYANEVNLLTDFTVYCTYSWGAINATTHFITSQAKPTRAWSNNFVLNVRAYLQACTFWLWLFSSYVYYSLVSVCLRVSAVTIVTTSFDRISFKDSS